MCHFSDTKITKAVEYMAIFEIRLQLRARSASNLRLRYGKSGPCTMCTKAHVQLCLGVREYVKPLAARCECYMP